MLDLIYPKVDLLLGHPKARDRIGETFPVGCLQHGSEADAQGIYVRAAHAKSPTRVIVLIGGGSRKRRNARTQLGIQPKSPETADACD